MKKLGRPRIIDSIDEKQFEELCKIHCTELEIASVLGVSHDTLFNWCKKTYNKTFKEAYAMFSDKGKASLRRTQLKLAENNPSMAIWLGKQWLGQRESVDISSENPIIVVQDVPARRE